MLEKKLIFVSFVFMPLTKLLFIFSLVFVLWGCGKVAQPSYKEQDAVNLIPNAFNLEDFLQDSIFSSEDRSWIRNSFIEFVRNRRFNGGVLVAIGDEIVLDTLNGYKDFRTKEKLNDSSAFQLASITKPITSTVILQLLQEGKLHLDDTLTQYLDLPKDPYSKITIKMLLSHQSGLAQYYYYCDNIIQNKNCILTNDCVLEVMGDFQPDYLQLPGKRFQYCNTNYVLLASVAEKIEQKDFDNIVKDRILIPAGMQHSFVLNLQKKEVPDHFVFGNNQFNRIVDFDYLDGVSGDKGLFASTKDLFAFDRYLNDCVLLSDSLFKTATEAHTIWDKNNSAYGLGWRLRMDPYLGKIVYHTGWWRGNRHIYFKIHELDVTVILLSNSLKGSVYNLNELLQIFHSTSPIQNKLLFSLNR